MMFYSLYTKQCSFLFSTGITVIYKCFLEDWSDIVEQQMVNYPVTEL